MKNTILAFAALGLFACGQPDAANRYAEIKKASWLLGAWQNNSPEAKMSETWTQLNDSVFAGESYVVVGADTVSSEKLRLAQEGAQLLYIPTVRDENQGKPVRFTMISASDTKLVFENPQHDFPQQISYTKISSDSLVAEISGMVNGKREAQSFPMRKVK